MLLKKRLTIPIATKEIQQQEKVKFMQLTYYTRVQCVVECEEVIPIHSKVVEKFTIIIFL